MTQREFLVLRGKLFVYFLCCYCFFIISTPKILAKSRRRAFGDCMTIIFMFFPLNFVCARYILCPKLKNVNIYSADEILITRTVMSSRIPLCIIASLRISAAYSSGFSFAASPKRSNSHAASSPSSAMPSDNIMI